MKKSINLGLTTLIGLFLIASCTIEQQINQNIEGKIVNTNYTDENSFNVSGKNYKNQTKDPEGDIMNKVYETDCENQGGELKDKLCIHPITGDDLYIEGLNNPLMKECQFNGGKWLDEFNECEGMNEEVCSDLGGNSNLCGSACRHEPDTMICTQKCVIFCSFD